jgi:histone-lysine N-methyltransferase SETMAR
MKVSRLAEETGISAGAVWTIIHEKLDMSKVSARRVPRMLSPFQKDTCRQCWQENLELLTADPEHFIQRLITGYETLVYHREPETKMESMQWKHKISPTPNKFRVEKSAGEVMATVFWDEKGLLLLEFMPQKTTLTGQTYANTITALREAIKGKRRGKISAVVLLLHENAPVHMSAKSQIAIRQCGLQQLNHPPYSPDLSPSDYFLF